MNYLFAAILTLIFLVNCYASWIVLCSQDSEKAQKLMQLGLVWLLPPMGAVLTISILKASPDRLSGDRTSKEMSAEEAWSYQNHSYECGHHGTGSPCD